MNPVRSANDPDSSRATRLWNLKEHPMGWFGSDTDSAFKKGYEHGLENSPYRLDTIDYSSGDPKESAAYRRGLRAGDRARERQLGRQVSRRRRW